MRDLLEAFTIFAKYAPDLYNPTHCEHDVMAVLVHRDQVSDEDNTRLETLSFSWDEREEHYRSFRFGSG